MISVRPRRRSHAWPGVRARPLPSYLWRLENTEGSFRQNTFVAVFFICVIVKLLVVEIGSIDNGRYLVLFTFLDKQSSVHLHKIMQTYMLGLKKRQMKHYSLNLIKHVGKLQ